MIIISYNKAKLSNLANFTAYALPHERESNERKLQFFLYFISFRLPVCVSFPPNVYFCSFCLDLLCFFIKSKSRMHTAIIQGEKHFFCFHFEELK